MPLVSVIIPTYNRATLLHRAIRSVLAQTFKDFELIVVDDGSTDSTGDVLAGFECCLKYLFQPNRGPSAARNLGANNSSGELLAFLDSDDEWLPEKLGEQVALFRGGKPFFICHTDEIWLRDGSEVPQREEHRKQGGAFFSRALKRCLISPSAVMISRRLFDQTGGFDENLPAAEDYDLWLRVTAFHEVDFVPKPLVIKHGGHSDQLSRCVPAIDRFRIQAILKILANPALRPKYREAAIKELIRKCRIVASGCRKRGRTAEAQAYERMARPYQVDSTEPL